MTIRSKIIACLVGMVGMFGLISYYQYHRAQTSNTQLTLVNALFLPLSRQIVSIQSNIQGYVEDSKRFYFSGVSPETSGFSRMARDVYPHVIARKMQAIENLLQKVSNGNKSELVDEIRHHMDRTKVLFQKLTEAKNPAELDTPYVQLKASLSLVSKLLEEESQKITGFVERESRESAITYSMLSLLVLGIGVASVLLSYRALSPLPELMKSLRLLSGGKLDLSFKVSRNSHDEISVLAREFNKMLEALRARDKKISEQQTDLLQSERLAAIGQLSAQVVHEIRNPLNSMSLNIDWLQEELSKESDEVRKTLTSISREILRLSGITESYLVQARLSTEETSRTPLNEVIQEIVAFERAERGNIDIDISLFPEELYVRADRSRLKQAFLNIVKNAKEAMPKGGKLIVKTEQGNNISKVCFSDTGHGMSEQVKNQTFKPFFTTKEKGTGLGLSLTKTIVEEAHGTLSCISELGKGTTFTFQFPA